MCCLLTGVQLFCIILLVISLDFKLEFVANAIRFQIRLKEINFIFQNEKYLKKIKIIEKMKSKVEKKFYQEDYKQFK